MANLGKMMKQLQQVQNKVMRMQEEIAEREIEATSGGGAVRVVASGAKKLLSVSIAPEAIDPDDPEMLEDLIVAAVNEVMDRVDAVTAEEMKKVTGGMELPPGLL
ncbi:MAG: YbaB/EbfC family nucleoid-associated protein [Firmicutes bacterium]|jgi:DNA-binding YbaB/EbfC family protein|nr:YbaB/EbfC family nucleoid-associated protein [Bacillota bacterium]